MNLLFIILDSADCELIDQLCKRGDLPFLAEFISQGCTTKITYDPSFFNVSSCFNLNTGMDVQQHEQYSYSLYDRETGKLTKLNPETIAKDTIFHALDEKGTLQLLIDIPRLPHLFLKNGRQVVDWYPHDRVTTKLTTTPMELEEYIRNTYGEDPFSGKCDDFIVHSAEHGDVFTNHLLDRIDNKTFLVLEELDKADYEVAAISYGDTHCAGHRCWHFHDPKHQSYSPNLKDTRDNPLTKAYRKIDQSISKICKHWNGSIAILANTGMQANHSNNQLLKIALQRFNQKVPHGRNRSLKNSIHSTSQEKQLQQSFALPVSDTVFAVRANVVGRDLNGVISPGKELESYLLELIQELLALRSMNGLEPIFLSYKLWTDINKLDINHNLPDVTFTWNCKTAVHAAGSTYLGLIYKPVKPKRTGTHTSNGRCWTNERSILPESIADHELLQHLIRNSN